MKHRGLPTYRPADNPFAAGRIEKLAYRADGFDIASLTTRLQQMQWRGAIVGPPGSGKTTLLECLAREVGAGAELVRLTGDCNRPSLIILGQLLPPAGSGGIVLLDSAGRLGPLEWWRLRRRYKSIVITSHRPGRLPTLAECTTSPRLLADLVRELTPQHANELEPMMHDLLDRHRGDVRACFRELYDLFAGIG